MTAILLCWLAIGLVGVVAMVIEEQLGGEVRWRAMLLASLCCLVYGPLLYPVVHHNNERELRLFAL